MRCSSACFLRLASKSDILISCRHCGKPVRSRAACRSFMLCWLRSDLFLETFYSDKQL